ncbi:hypothetical protein DRQ25_05200 [Candidatus Fermentibacteria bacterium]|nr:MAG: hypothetical protein DRQ25_05200 [Candidatus Fermentibacteria bacterium]
MDEYENRLSSMAEAARDLADGLAKDARDFADNLGEEVRKVEECKKPIIEGHERCGFHPFEEEAPFLDAIGDKRCMPCVLRRVINMGWLIQRSIERGDIWDALAYAHTIIACGDTDFENDEKALARGRKETQGWYAPGSGILDSTEQEEDMVAFIDKLNELKEDPHYGVHRMGSSGAICSLPAGHSGRHTVENDE